VTIQFKPAVRHNELLIIGLAGGTGSGKTKSGMRLATGMSGGKRFGVIDTEARRALHYADEHAFDHAELLPPFRPEAYVEAIKAAESAKYSVIVIDSFSHEWYGEGGVLDWQEEELDRMAGTDYNRREACKQASWIKPKMAHKQMVQKLLQVRAHLIICMRAEEKTELVKDDKGKWHMEPKRSLVGLDGWIPICDKKFPFELTASFLLTSDQPGIPHPIKLEDHHRPFFAPDRQIDETAGQRLAEWAAGGKPVEAVSAAALVKSYEACAPGDDKVLAELEAKARAAWNTFTGEQTKALNAARAAAKKRVVVETATGT
jgi:hypothetical protein